MLILKSKVNVFFLVGMISLIPITVVSSAPIAGWDKTTFISLLQGNQSKENKTRGYTDITVYGDQFVAVGSEGRIDIISRSGKVSPVANDLLWDMNGVIWDKQAIIAVGDGGTILISADGKTCRKIESGTRENINSITSFNGIIIAASDKGIIVVEKVNKCININLQLKGKIVSVSADESDCFGVTDKGEIIKSGDSINWDIFDYNSEYAGFSKPCSFKNVLSAGKRIVVAGEHEDGTPVVLFSSLGNVWTERTLNYTDNNGAMGLLTSTPSDITYDSGEDQFFVVCSKGEILSLPSCTKCNKLFTLKEKNPSGIANFNDSLIVVGEDYYIYAFSTR
jgi:hypothetical protein